MHLRLLPKFLLAATLLLGVLSCKKKEDAAPARGTSSYKINGRSVSGISFTLPYPNTTRKTDELIIIISDTPTFQDNTQTVTLYFEKPTGQASTAYQLTSMTYTPDNMVYTPKISFPKSEVTIRETSPGVFSGTFSGVDSPNNTLSEGIFTDARQQP